MMLSRRRRAVSFLAIAMVMALATQAFAAQTTVSLVTVSGSRTMAVKSLSGTDLNALALGSAREAGFLVNVTDVAYDRRNYQVTAMISNIYKHDGLNFQCNEPAIAASKLSIGFLANPTRVADVAAAAQPVLNFVGTITDPVLLGLLGLGGPTSVATSVTQNLQDFATSTIYSGIENALPVKVATGAGGTFTNAAPHATCDPSAAGATSVQVQQGTVNNHTDLLAWVQSTANGVYNAAAGPDGVLSAAEAVSSGMTGQAGMDVAVRNALTGAPLNINPLLVTASVISQVEGVLAAPASTVSSILRQTGSYSSLPKLVVGDLSGIPTGTYRGTMTVTLIDE